MKDYYLFLEMKLMGFQQILLIVQRKINGLQYLSHNGDVHIVTMYLKLQILLCGNFMKIILFI